VKLKNALINEALSDREKKHALWLADKVIRGKVDLGYIEKAKIVNKDMIKLIQKKVKAHRADFIKHFVTHKGNPVFLD
jgi:hypothetical protein